MSTLAPIEPVAAEYAPAGGDSAVIDRTGAVAPTPGHVTDSVTCRIELLPVPPLSHALVVDVWLDPLHVLGDRELDAVDASGSSDVWPGVTCVVNREGSAAGPRTFSIADVARWAATTRWRVSPDTRVRARTAGRGNERDEEERGRDDDLDDGESRFRVEPVPPNIPRDPSSTRRESRPSRPLHGSRSRRSGRVLYARGPGSSEISRLDACQVRAPGNTRAASYTESTRLTAAGSSRGGRDRRARTRTASRAIRSACVCEVHERMLTWCSDSTSAMSRSRLGTVERLDLDRHRVVAGRVVVPLDLDDAVGLTPQAHRVRAVGAVHRDATTTGDEAHDLVAGNRRAATREPDHDVVEALDVHADVAVRRDPAHAAGGRRVVGSCSSPPRRSRWMRCTTALADTCPSPMPT